MKHAFFWVAMVCVAGLLVAALWLLRTRVPSSFPADSQSGVSEMGPLAGLTLYFGSPDGRGLQSETRLVPRTGVFQRDVRAVIAALGQGSLNGGLTAWPREPGLKEMFVSPDGIAYLDFSRDLRWACPRGDFMEWLLAATLTRTLCENFPALSGVHIMIEGRSTGPLIETLPLEVTLRPAMFMEEG